MVTAATATTATLHACAAHVEGQDGRMRPAVEAFLCGVPGLVVTTLDPRQPWWRITHAGSGRAIGGGAWGADSCRFGCADEAAVVAQLWLDGVDWQRTAEELSRDKQAAAAVRRMVVEVGAALAERSARAQAQAGADAEDGG